MIAKKKKLKKPYRILDGARRGEIIAWIRLLELAHKKADSPGMDTDDPHVPPYTRSLWHLAQSLRALVRGKDARVVFHQAPGRGNRAPNIEALVAEIYHREHKPGRRGPGVKTVHMTCNKVRAVVGRTEAELSDATIKKYQSRNRAEALSRLRIEKLHAEIMGD